MQKKDVKKVNKKVVKKKRPKKALIFVLLSLILGLAVIALIYIFTNSKFNITSIEIKNNSYYTKDEIRKATKINNGTNIFRVTKGRVLNNLQQLPYIQNITISRNLPSKIIINVKERSSKYLAYNKDTREYVRLSDEGVILEIVDRAELKQGEMLTFGINFDDNLKIGEKISDLEYKKIGLYKNTYEKYKKNKIQKEITSIKFENDTITLILEYNLGVIFEEKDLDYDMSILSDILKEIEGKEGTIDMTKPDPIFTGNIN